MRFSHALHSSSVFSRSCCLRSSLGDNPCVRQGAPLAIDWNYCDEEVQDFDMYEYIRKQSRRNRKKLILNVQKRAQILHNAGYDITDIAQATMNVLLIKEQRRKSAMEGGRNKFLKNVNVLDLISGAAEATGRTFKLNKAIPTLTDVATDAIKGTGSVIIGTGKGIVQVSTTVATGTGNVILGVANETGKVGKRASNIGIGIGKTSLTLMKGGLNGTTSLIKQSGRSTSHLLKSSGKRVGRLFSVHVPSKRVTDAVQSHTRKNSVVSNNQGDEESDRVALDIAAMVAAMDEDVLQSIMDDLDDADEIEVEFSDDEEELVDTEEATATLKTR